MAEYFHYFAICADVLCCAESSEYLFAFWPPFATCRHFHRSHIKYCDKNSTFLHYSRALSLSLSLSLSLLSLSSPLLSLSPLIFVIWKSWAPGGDCDEFFGTDVFCPNREWQSVLTIKSIPKCFICFRHSIGSYFLFVLFFPFSRIHRCLELCWFFCCLTYWLSWLPFFQFIV